jgi:hypothetical protein
VKACSYKVPAILTRFLRKFLKIFRKKKLKYQTIKINSVGAELFYADALKKKDSKTPQILSLCYNIKMWLPTYTAFRIKLQEPVSHYVWTGYRVQHGTNFRRLRQTCLGHRSEPLCAQKRRSLRQLFAAAYFINWHCHWHYVFSSKWLNSRGRP